MIASDELLDALMKNCRKPGDLIGENGLLKQMSRLSLELARQAGITEQMGFPPQEKSRCRLTT